MKLLGGGRGFRLILGNSPDFGVGELRITIIEVNGIDFTLVVL